jgi:type I restriction enzyme S subunit
MVPYLRAANVKDGALDLGDVKSMNFSPNEQAVFSLERGDVLVTEGSGSLTSVGASAVWNADLSGTVCFQNTLLRLRPRRGTDPRFLAWWCRYAFVDGLFASIATGANIFHVSAERIRSLPMTYLPLRLQRQIAEYLDLETGLIDDLLTAQAQLIKLLYERIDAMIKSVIEGSALAGGTSIALVPLKRVLHKVSRPVTSEAPVVTAYRDGEVNSRLNRREDGYTLALNEDTYQGVRRGDVVIHGLDGFSGAIGVSRTDGCCSPVYHVCEALGDCDARYIARLLRVLALDGYIGSHATSIRERAVDLRNWDLVGSIRVPIPDPGEQKLVGELIDRVLPIENAVARLSSLLRERRQALIAAAMTSQLNLPDTA